MKQKQQTTSYGGEPMIKKDTKQMQIDFLGMKMQSPFIIGSGPISFGSPGLIHAHKMGAGAVVTKTIRDIPADNPYPHIISSGKNNLVNAEKWTDIPGEQWIQEDIPQAKAQGVNVIASIGHTPEEVEHWVEGVAVAGADCIELVSYSEESMLPMIKIAKERVDLPIIAKISPNWPDPVQSAIRAVEMGADAITAIDSLGPALRVDIKTGRPVLGGESGYGWLTGEALRPIAQAIVAEIAKNVQVPIIGLGGVMNAADGFEMLMVGASAIGICSTLIINGINYLEKLIIDVAKLMEQLDYKSISEISGKSLVYLNQSENQTKIDFEFDPEKCINCKKCVKVCPYQARELDQKKMKLNEELCRYCGFCTSICPVQALKIRDSRVSEQEYLSSCQRR